MTLFALILMIIASHILTILAADMQKIVLSLVPAYILTMDVAYILLVTTANQHLMLIYFHIIVIMRKSFLCITMDLIMYRQPNTALALRGMKVTHIYQGNALM